MHSIQAEIDRLTLVINEWTAAARAAAQAKRRARQGVKGVKDRLNVASALRTKRLLMKKTLTPERARDLQIARMGTPPSAKTMSQARPILAAMKDRVARRKASG